MTIAILAWGSLIWDPQALRVEGTWNRIGPALPLEFSRVSMDGRLTLVVDEENGAPTQTWTARSSFEDIDTSITNLQERERMPNRNRVGFVNIQAGLHSDFARRLHPGAVSVITDWAKGKDVDGVIWTALGVNFREKVGEKFSIDNAVRYVSGLEAEKRTRALTYIRNAPAEIRTPVREALDKIFLA